MSNTNDLVISHRVEPLDNPGDPAQQVLGLTKDATLSACRARSREPYSLARERCGLIRQGNSTRSDGVIGLRYSFGAPGKRATSSPFATSPEISTSTFAERAEV